MPIYITETTYEIYARWENAEEARQVQYMIAHATGAEPVQQQIANSAAVELSRLLENEPAVRFNAEGGYDRG